MIDWLIDIQRWLYGGMSEGIKASAGISELPSLMAAALLFGIVHALMPGHGKSILVSYHLGRPSRFIEGVTTGVLLAVTHIGIAVLFVLLGVALISRSFTSGGRAPAMEVASAGFIIVIGCYFLFRVFRPSRHMHTHDGPVMAVVAGLVPCPLTTFVLTYALAHERLVAGLAAVGAMAIGVVVTLVGFALSAVFLRERFVTMLQKTELLRDRLGFGLGLFSAVVVLALGIRMLADGLGHLG